MMTCVPRDAFGIGSIKERSTIIPPIKGGTEGGYILSLVMIYALVTPLNLPFLGETLCCPNLDIQTYHYRAKLTSNLTT